MRQITVQLQISNLDNASKVRELRVTANVKNALQIIIFCKKYKMLKIVLLVLKMHCVMVETKLDQSLDIGDLMRRVLILLNVIPLQRA